jgi:hypothetical protein
MVSGCYKSLAAINPSVAAIKIAYGKASPTPSRPSILAAGSVALPRSKKSCPQVGSPTPTVGLIGSLLKENQPTP